MRSVRPERWKKRTPESRGAVGWVEPHHFALEEKRIPEVRRLRRRATARCRSGPLRAFPCRRRRAPRSMSRAGLFQLPSPRLTIAESPTGRRGKARKWSSGRAGLMQLVRLYPRVFPRFGGTSISANWPASARTAKKFGFRWGVRYRFIARLGRVHAAGWRKSQADGTRRS